MPELPEVEIIRRGLAPAMEGASFAAVTLNRADLRFPFCADFVTQLLRKRVSRLSRRAKYILAVIRKAWALARYASWHDGPVHHSAPGCGRTVKRPVPSITITTPTRATIMSSLA